MDPARLSPLKRKQVFDNRTWDEALGGREIPIDSGVNSGTKSHPEVKSPGLGPVEVMEVTAIYYGGSLPAAECDRSQGSNG
jgi:hypothetical protein